MNKPFFKSVSGCSLFLERVFVEYDGPLFFLCKDTFQTNFLCAASIETDDFRSWTVVKATVERIIEVLNDQITLYDLFKQAESGKILYIKGFFKQEFDEFIEIDCAVIDENLLPAKDSYLELPDAVRYSYDLQKKPSDSILQRAANDSFAVHYDIKIVNTKHPDLHSFPAIISTWIVQCIEDIRLTMQASKGVFLKRSSERHYKESSFYIYAAAPGSLVFELRAQKGSFAPGDVEDSLESLFALLEYNSLTNDFCAFINRYSTSLISSYKKLTTLLVSNNYEMGLKAAFPGRSSLIQLHLSSQDIMERKFLLDQLEDEKREEVVAVGVLSGLEPWKKEVFSFLADDEDDYFTGKIEKTFLDEIRNGNVEYTVPQRVTIGLIRLIRYPDDEERRKVSYLMSFFKPE